jgi:tRNA (adenine37-N6)-methyltransferase
LSKACTYALFIMAEYPGAPFLFSLLACSALCASRVRDVRRRAAQKKNGKGGGKKAASSTHFPIYEIGVVKSCFRECRGTPRQGSFAPSTKGKIVFHKRVPYAALEGLENFSHVWVLFIFHQNTNFSLTSRTHLDHRHSFRPKVKPPALKGKSIGLFATRTPHRPNALGITLAKIEKVLCTKRTVVLSAIDLVDGTPVVDIKPYVTPYDSVPVALTPRWCGIDVERTPHHVTILDSQKEEIRDAAENGRLRHYTDGEKVCRALIELLSKDVRPLTSYSSKRRNKGGEDGGKTINRFRFDMLRVGFSTVQEDGSDGRSVVVEEVVVETERDERDMASGKKQRYPSL